MAFGGHLFCEAFWSEIAQSHNKAASLVNSIAGLNLSSRLHEMCEQAASSHGGCEDQILPALGCVNVLTFLELPIAMF